MFNRLHLFVYSLCLITVLLSACSTSSEQTTKTVADRVTVTVVGEEITESPVILPGAVELPFTTDLGFSTEGMVERLYVQEGSIVKSGQRLAQLEQTMYAASTAAASTATAAAQERFATSRQLDSTGSIARAAYREDFHQLESALAAEKLAVVKQKQTTLYARADGIITARFVDVGAFIHPGQKIFQFMRKEPLKIVCIVPVNIRNQLNEGMSCIISRAGDDTGRLDGKIDFINPVPDPTDKQFRVKISLYGSQSPLPPATAVSVTFSRQRTKVLVLPQAAIHLDDSGRTYVYSIHNDTCRQTFISVKGAGGKVNQPAIEGLLVGDSVVLAGPANLDNKPVTPVPNQY
ncbi:efflux RND transporter periplasmic adaptor subunit [uncultured Chitinophaga sp.]|uniref:efflux RND transporter periplasmic adaptor subunit n=1 Tax=uncultured Chitinophaga sp. TaxID=339340 RepID=UPI00260781F7|nr:efflux RND transporter periplasmic adaptor subunit [uncultured Chitinophaga sp.]